MIPTVVEGLGEGGAVLEGRNFEGVANHVDVFTGHKDDEEADDSENAFSGDMTTANVRNAIDKTVIKKRHGKTGTGFGKILDARNPLGNTAEDGESRPEFNQGLDHKDIGEKEHNHSDRKNGKIGDDIS